MTPAELVRRLRDRGVVLSLKGDALGYRGPKGAVTAEDRALLAEHRDGVRDYLRRLGHYRASLIPALLAQLADAGFHVVLAHGPRIEAAEGADEDAVDPAIVDAINDRLDELVAFLRKSSADMTDAELAALGFRRNGDGVVMLVADVPEFEGAWSPPHGWGAGSPGPATRPDAARRKRPAAPAGTPLLDACDKEEREPIAEQDRAGGDATFEVPE